MSSSTLPESQLSAIGSHDAILARWASTVADALGSDVLFELTGFVKSAGPGAMVTIRCTRDGFTAQVTGPIVGGKVRSLADVVVLMDEERGPIDGR